MLVLEYYDFFECAHAIEFRSTLFVLTLQKEFIKMKIQRSQIHKEGKPKAINCRLLQR